MVYYTELSRLNASGASLRLDYTSINRLLSDNLDALIDRHDNVTVFYPATNDIEVCMRSESPFLITGIPCLSCFTS